MQILATKKENIRRWRGDYLIYELWSTGRGFTKDFWTVGQMCKPTIQNVEPCVGQGIGTWPNPRVIMGNFQHSQPGERAFVKVRNFELVYTPRLAALPRRSRRGDSCESESPTLTARLNFYTCLLWKVMISTVSRRTSDVFLQEDNNSTYVLFMYEQYPHVLRPTFSPSGSS